MKHPQLSKQKIHSFYHVYNTLGYGFLEKVYENTLYLELTGRGMHCVKQFPIEVFYKQNKIGL